MKLYNVRSRRSCNTELTFLQREDFRFDVYSLREFTYARSRNFVILLLLLLLLLLFSLLQVSSYSFSSLQLAHVVETLRRVRASPVCLPMFPFIFFPLLSFFFTSRFTTRLRSIDDSIHHCSNRRFFILFLFFSSFLLFFR